MKWINLLFFCLFGFGVKGQTLKIKDEFNGQPIPYAAIISKNGNNFLTSDSLGIADLSSWEKADSLEISFLGYESVNIGFPKEMLIIYLKRISTSLEEVVVSGDRWKQNSGKIATISPERIVFLNPQTTADVLGATGEVFIQKSQQGGGSPMIRGFAANRLLYSIDGVRMNTAIFRSGNIQNVISLDPFSLEKTEVLFGPGSVKYGSDAIGGVLNFQTLTPTFSAKTKTHSFTRYSSANNEITQHADVSIGGQKWGMISSLTYSHFGDLKMGKYGPDEYLKPFVVNGDEVLVNQNPRIQDPTGYDQINLMQKFRVKLRENWDLQYGFHYSSTTNFSRYDRLIETKDGLPVFAVWDYGPQRWMMNQLSVTNPKIGMSIRLASQYFEESRKDRRLNQQRLRTQKEQVNAYSLNVDFERNKWRYGVEWVLNDVNSMGFSNVGSVPDRYPESLWMSYGGYVQYDLSLSKRHRIQCGLRYSGYWMESDFSQQLIFFPFDFEKTTLQNSALTGSIAWNFIPRKGWEMNAGIATGFRAPNVDDIGKIFDFVSGEVIVPNPALKAEYAWNGDLNMVKKIEPGIKIEAGIFYTRLEGAMVRRPFALNGRDSIMYNGVLSRIYAIQNTAFTEVFGWTLGLEWKLHPNLEFYSRFNFQWGVEEMDNGQRSPSRHSAPNFGWSGIRWTKEKWTAESYVVFQNKVEFDRLNPEERGKPAIYAMDDEGRPWSPSWYAIHLKTSWNINKHWGVGLGLENITNQRYRPYSSGLAGPGFNAVVFIKLRT